MGQLNTTQYDTPARTFVPPVLHDGKHTMSVGIGAPAIQVQPPPAAFLDLPLDDLQVRLAEPGADMAQVVELRREIDLAAAMSVDPDFLAHEKKETN